LSPSRVSKGSERPHCPFDLFLSQTGRNGIFL